MRLIAALNLVLPLICCCLICGIIDVESSGTLAAKQATAIFLLVALCGSSFLMAMVQLVRSPQGVATGPRTAPVISLVLIGITVVCYFSAVEIYKVKTASDHLENFNNMKQIVLGMHEYEEKNKRLPPAALYSGQGKPLLSWRVLILPHIEQDRLFGRFRLDEPWDSPHNITLLKEMPAIYAHPRDETSFERWVTHYRVFVGPGAAFEGEVGIPLSDFKDGTDKTILLVDAAEAVPWTKPDELIFDDNHSVRDQLNAAWSRIYTISLADKHTRSLPATISEKTLRALITRNAGDEPGNDW